MKVEFNKGTTENPLNYFEDFFSNHGQKKAKIAFLSWVLPLTEPLYNEHDDQIDYATLKYDLEKEVFFGYISGTDPISGKDLDEIQEYKYFDYLKHRLMKPQRQIFKNEYKKRIDGCDSADEEHFVKRKMLGKIDRMANFLEQNKDVPHGDRLKLYIEKLRKHIESVKLTNPSITKKIDKENSTSRNKSKKQHKVSRLSELSSHVPMESLMNFLKTNKFIRCSKGEVAKLNYYFGIGNSQKKPESKIEWLKDSELLKTLMKKGFNKGPKYQTASQVFNIEGVPEREIAEWGDRHINKIKDYSSKNILLNFIKENLQNKEKR